MREYIWEQSQQLNKKEQKKSTNIKTLFLQIEQFTLSSNNDKNDDDDINDRIRMFKQFSSPPTTE